MKTAKFGGTSLADAARFRQVKRIVSADPELRFVVVSAPGKRSAEDKKVTDLLYDCHAAVKTGADGVHIGQSDMDGAKARALLGPDKILGISARTVEQARKAQADGADYLGVGAVFHTSTKKDAHAVDFQTLKQICQSVTIPVVAIGGISKENLLKLKGSGVCGVALVSAVFAADDIRKECRELHRLSSEMVEG